MCFKFPAFFGVEIQEIERTPYGKQVVKTTTYGYTGPKEQAHTKRKPTRRDSYHSRSSSNSDSIYTGVPAALILPPSHLPPPRYEYNASVAGSDAAGYVEIVDAVPSQVHRYALPPSAAPSPPFRRQTVSQRPLSGRFEQPVEYSGRTHRVSLPPGVTVERRNTIAATPSARRPESGVRYISTRNSRNSRSSNASDTDSSLSSSDASEASEMGAGRRRR
ncbi:hypothetical protein BZA05DRAFT_443569 [Tricharina praecox]|uniref:uncharacterized protein n=1 Tax=Tricharina praecox TaxID=43433 RepID=UPI00222060FA|nr:uncharacterized protein BZA05DRAFT_443569 [Tricharina praecox]KAI5854940.1 hypothetical protein BZA05DRAFT_443569 [Tricharina praecox]